MAHKFRYLCTDLDHKTGSAKAVVHFEILEDGGAGNFGAGTPDAIPFDPAFPLASEAAIKTQAVAAITAKYAGAVEE